MARHRKVRAHDYYAPPGAGKMRHLGAKAYVKRMRGQPRKFAFEACIMIGRGHKGLGRNECAHGTSPHKALGKAMKKLGARLTSSRSAFSGWRR